MAVNFTHSVGIVYKSDSGTLTSTTDSFVGDGEVNYKGQIQPNTTNGRITMPVTAANVRSMVLYSDQAMTIKTNSTTTPQETITLLAKVQIVWNTLSTGSIPYAGNVTDFYCTLGNVASAANLTIAHLVDTTPVLGDPA